MLAMNVKSLEGACAALCSTLKQQWSPSMKPPPASALICLLLIAMSSSNAALTVYQSNGPSQHHIINGTFIQECTTLMEGVFLHTVASTATAQRAERRLCVCLGCMTCSSVKLCRLFSSHVSTQSTKVTNIKTCVFSPAFTLRPGLI